MIMRTRTGILLVVLAAVTAFSLPAFARPEFRISSVNASLADVPDFKEIMNYKPALTTTVYTRDGRVLGYLYREKRFLVPLSEMPDYLVQAFLAAEDASFYEHEGIDLTAIFRAFSKNVAAGAVVQGGSTITQQIVKRLLLSTEQTYVRKAKEAILAYRLERHLSKKDILAIYLNDIFLGAGAYGVEAGARTYFGKHVQDLNLAEAAVLAGLPKAPSKYNPYHRPEDAKERQTYVLGRMLELGWITQAQHDEALAQSLVYKEMADPSWKLGAYYLEEVRRWLIDYFKPENLDQEGQALDRLGEDAVYEGGLHVFTAIDLEHQAAAEKALRTGLRASSKRRGWRGPLRTLEPNEIDEYAAANGPDDKDLQGLLTGGWIRVVVTKVEADKATVRAGSREGVIPVETLHWCRKPNLERPTEAVRAVKDAREVLNPGDVVWASYLPTNFEPRIHSLLMFSEWDRKLPPDPEYPATLPAEGPLPLRLEQMPVVQGGVVSLEPPTGEVVALVGGYDFQHSHFNRATQAHRQPGSAFKPIVYSAAMDSGFTPASVVEDQPIEYWDPVTKKLWKPQNYKEEYFGPTLLRTALAKSRNIVTVQIAERIGINKIIARAKALGLEPDFPPYLSIALGSQVVRPINLCKAYTAFARGGTTVDPRLVLSISSSRGREIYHSAPEVQEAISPQNAYIMTTLLKHVVQTGTGTKAKLLNRPIAGKTGTTNDQRDAWFMGFTPYLLTGVYVGFDNFSPMGDKETGSRAALPIWVKYRMHVEDEYPEEDFKTPGGIVFENVADVGQMEGTTWSLPFMDGTQPSVSGTHWVMQNAPIEEQEDFLLKQMFY
ncbi:penicillin-binding protein 1A [Oceanidesulfovibrio marinus]|uniref:Penicillin-binding protein 1A n=1 Tax=Oceanidesulfovibrio marinus TaxID=370038 RepID=A0A6P1ZJ69_9BACT|nr:PBP1A family penicillin-binding protein [Oceanidesulfovibrio marinus]QJT10145.1 PBP1A family penicillin-binding protein [Oceanidesulfovibrio marinus]TVM35741.1 penicillin-binding protein [Oceanidesulfovibrio marinus]